MFEPQTMETKIKSEVTRFVSHLLERDFIDGHPIRSPSYTAINAIPHEILLKIRPCYFAFELVI